jgi:hypothetical protein
MTLGAMTLILRDLAFLPGARGAEKPIHRVVAEKPIWTLNSRIETAGGRAPIEIGPVRFRHHKCRSRQQPRSVRVLDFKVQIRSGLPCNEWGAAAGAAMSFFRGPATAGENE